MTATAPDVAPDHTGARVRVGYYLFAPRLGGAEAYVRDVIRGLDRVRFEPVVFVPPWDGLIRFLGLDRNSGVSLRTVNTSEPSVTFRGSAMESGFGVEAPQSLMRRVVKRAHLPSSVQRAGLDLLRYSTLSRNRKTLDAALTHTPVDILHVINGGYPGAVSALAAVMAGRARARCVALTVCSTAMPRTILFPIEQRLDRRVADSVDAVIVPAERPGEALLAREFKRSTIRTIPWGVSAPSPSDRLEARRKLGLGAETLLIACVGNFTPTKGQGAVVEAVATLYPRFPSIRAVLAGDGPCRGEVRDLANHRGVADVVDLPGQLGQPWDLLRAADVFVLASEIEGLPLAVLEALSQGTPVVATNVGGMPEAVVPGVTGLLVTPHRPEQLAAALATVLSDPRLRDEMGAAARVRYEQRFTTESMLNSHERLYGDLLTSAERRKR